MAAPQYTPSSEIIHLVHTFGDTLDALPPALTRSLSDLKELDAVLSGSLNNITSKLQRLLTMMNTPSPDHPQSRTNPSPYTPYDRLKLLREVTEDARVFRLGGEDKIRVATSTCETIATHQNHLSTLSTLLLEFLPALMLPTLPAPSAPHGYPQSNTPETAIQRRQMFHLPPERHPGQGSTFRISGAMGMARDHYEASSSRNITAANAAGGPMGAGGGGAAAGGNRNLTTGSGVTNGSHKKVRQTPHSLNGIYVEKDGVKHPNQYTKKRLAQAQLSAQANAAGLHTLNAVGGAIANPTHINHQNGVYANSNHQFGGLTAVEAVKEKRRLAGTNSNTAIEYAQNGVYHDEFGQVQQQQQASNTSTGTTGARAGGKRKGDDGYGARKKSKKGLEASPDLSARSLANSTAAAGSASASTSQSTKPARRAATSAISAIKDSTLDPFGLNAQTQSNISAAANQQLQQQQQSMSGTMMEDDQGDEDEADKTIYCSCQRPSFGEMIACDGPNCPHEWFHLDCLRMSSAPKGSWFCDHCRAEKEKKKGGRR